MLVAWFGGARVEGLAVVRLVVCELPRAPGQAGFGLCGLWRICVEWVVWDVAFPQMLSADSPVNSVAPLCPRMWWRRRDLGQLLCFPPQGPPRLPSRLAPSGA